MTQEEKERVWNNIRAALDARKAAHEESQRRQRLRKLVAWIQGGKK